MQNSESNGDSSLPAGLICAFPSNDIPAGWLPLDGQEYDSEMYPELVSSIIVWMIEHNFLNYSRQKPLAVQ